MKLKSKIGLFLLACVIGISALFLYPQKEPYSTQAVLDAIWDNYHVQSTMIAGGEGSSEPDPILDVSVYEEDEVNEVVSYLKNNLSKEDLEYYTISVYVDSPNPQESWDNQQEGRIE